MTAPKQIVAALLESLPDDCSLEDIQYHLYVAGKISGTIKRVEAGAVVSEEAADARLGKWLLDWLGTRRARRR